MAAISNKKSRRLAGLALAVSVFATPGLAVAQEDGGRGDWHARSEEGSRPAPAEDQDNGGQRDRQAPQEQARAAPQEQSVPPQQAGWSGNSGGNGGGGTDWGGGHRDRSADQSDERRGRDASNDAPQATRPAPQQQPAQPGWAGRPGRASNGDGNHEGGGRNWTDANLQNRDSGDRDQHDDRQRDRNGGYISGGNYYGNNSGYDHHDRDDDRDHHQWDRQWRNNTSYNWYSYRSSHPSYYRLGTYYSPYRNYSYRRLSIGFFLDNLFFGQNYQIEDPQYYRLPAVYGPYRWVRYYDDAVLVDIYSGEVVDVINNFFW